MKTLQIKKIDGIEIVIGFQKRLIDPEATHKNTLQLINDLTETETIKSKVVEMDQFIKKAGLENQNAILFQKKNIPQSNMHEKRSKQHLESAKTCRDEIITLKNQINLKSRDIRRENPVYFEPRKNEIVKTDEEIFDIESKFNAKKLNEQINTVGAIVDDFRGFDYSKKVSGKWKRNKITKLGVKIPAGSKLDQDLTTTEKEEVGLQVEIDRLSLMSAEEKTAEKQQAIDTALNDSIQMRSGLEIKSDPKALTKSQAWYATKVAEIEEKYL